MVLRVSVKVARKQARVQERIVKKSVGVLYRAGNYLRKTIRRKVRKRNDERYSRPDGRPIGKGNNEFLRNSIQFDVDERQLEVFVGPKLRDGQTEKVAKIVEFGGTVHRREERKLVPKKMVRKSAYARNRGGAPDETIPWDSDKPDYMLVYMPAKRDYKPRPFVGPAFDAFVKADRFPQLFVEREGI